MNKSNNDKERKSVLNMVNYYFDSIILLRECNLAVIRIKDKYAIFDINEKKVICSTLVDSDADRLNDEILSVLKFLLVNKNFNNDEKVETFSSDFIELISILNDFGLSLIKNKDKYLVFNINDGRMICDNLTSIDFENFSEGMLPVKRNNLWGYVNVVDMSIIFPKYASVSKFENGYAFVYRFKDENPTIVNGHKYGVDTRHITGIIDKSGYEIMPPMYDVIGNLNNDFILGYKREWLDYCNSLGEKCYLFDIKRHRHIPFKFTADAISYSKNCYMYHGYDAKGCFEYKLHYRTFYHIDDADDYVLVRCAVKEWGINEKEQNISYYVIDLDGKVIDIDDLYSVERDKVKKYIKEKI